MELLFNGHTKEINDMSEDFKLDLVNEIKELHKEVANLWKANTTMQREVLERANSIDKTLTTISVTLEKDGHTHQSIAAQVFKNRDILEQRGIRLAKVEQTLDGYKWAIGILTILLTGVASKVILDWISK